MNADHQIKGVTNRSSGRSRTVYKFRCSLKQARREIKVTIRSNGMSGMRGCYRMYPGPKIDIYGIF